MNTTASVLDPATESVVDSATVSECERYLFDLQGYLVVPDAITPEHCAALDAEVTRRLAAEVNPIAVHHRFDPKNPTLAWGEPWLRLIDNPRILPYMHEFMGAEIRLDHDYVDVIRAGQGPIGSWLHGGSTPFDECFAYLHRDGRIRSALTVVAYALRDVHPGDGGFGCIPGSHKANYSTPKEFMDLSKSTPCVAAVTLKAGSAVIFTEALAHGTLPWRGLYERRTVFYKYSPRTISWSASFYDAKEYPGITPGGLSHFSPALNSQIVDVLRQNTSCF